MTSRRIQWDVLRSVIESADAPRALRLDGLPAVYLFYEPATRRLGLRVPVGAAEVPGSPLAQLSIEQRTVDGKDVVEISTTSPTLYPYFHGFAISVADRVQHDGLDSNAAVLECLARWRDLLRQAVMLSPERQLGLMGELWLLDRLVTTRGPAEALAAWTGPRGEAHDFRFESTEVEVKTTTGEHRVHVISSDTQLMPSPGNRLHLLSLQYASAGSGAGASLGGLIAALRARVDQTSAAKVFDDALEASFGLSGVDLSLYDVRLKLRTSPYLVKVDSRFPRLILAELSALIDVARVSDVRYRVNVEGLGVEEGTPAFTDVLGEV